MIRDHLASLVSGAFERLVQRGEAPQGVYPNPEIAEPKNPEHGDYATNFAMVVAKTAGQNPRALAELLVQELAGESDVRSAEVAGPGFVNLCVSPEYLAQVAASIAQGRHFTFRGAARLPESARKRINVEFVSVNPNGPITIGSGRGAAYGSTLCNVLEAAGHTVHREYYINDGVNSEQMRLFAASVEALANGWPAPENGYKGDYVHDVAKAAAALGGALDPRIAEAPVDGILPHPAPSRYDASAFNEVVERLVEGLLPENRAGDAWSEPVSKLWLHIVAQALAARSGHIAFEAQDGGAVRVTLSDPAAPAALMDLPSDLWSELRVLILSRFESIQLGDWTVYGLSGGVSSHTLDEGAVVLARETPAGAEVRLLPLRLAQLAKRGDLMRVFSEQTMIAQQRLALELFGVEFDTWYSEQALHESGAVAHEIDALVAGGVADEMPVRTKLKLGKGGTVDDVETEAQESAEDESWAAGVSCPDTPVAPALWLRSTKFGDDMDRVLRRQDGRLTYIASDVAYHKDKFNRPPGADKLITILGPDHHGYIGRLQAVVAAMLVAEGRVSVPDHGGGPLDATDARLFASPVERDRCRSALAMAREKLEVQIFQLVRFMKDGQPAPMRKRDGNIYALIDLLREIGQAAAPEDPEVEQLRIGRDVARYFYLMRSHDTTFDFDLGLAEKQSDENPVFYVQYAHARICSLIAKAHAEGLAADRSRTPLLDHPKELALIKKLADLPYEVRRCAEDYGVHRLTTYVAELARQYHLFYEACRVIAPEDPERSKDRLLLCEATRAALRWSFDLLGVSAPERM